MNESVWILSPLKDKARSLSAELGIPLEIAQILANRKVCDTETAHKFLFGTLDDLHDPFLMKGMQEAVKRLRKAASIGEKVLIFGDYDVDGILSVVMLSKALETLGAKVDYFIPDRLKQGYGIKEEYVEVAVEKAANVVVSVDCGMKAIQFAKRAKEKGIDVIITDHHLPGPFLPEALAVLNPVLSGSGYPDKNLAGVGVVFKLIQALFKEEKEAFLLPHYLKLVSIGTIADVAELRGENRLFVKFGLKGLEKVSNKGLLSLIEVCGLTGRDVSVGDVGFRIGPRINAAGRMGMTDLAMRLFLSDSLQEVKEIAHQLDKLNSKRQKIEERIYDQAMDRIKKRSLDKRYKILIMGCEEWHRGVSGIIASRLKDFFYRPVILFVYKDGKAFGSGRSIREFPLIDCLDKNRDFFTSYGGHTMAIGCELAHKNMNPFRRAVNTFADSTITDEHLKRKIYIDVSINFKDISLFFIENLSFLSPFGVGNPKPIFLTENVEVVSNPKKIQGKHVKFLVKQDGRIFEALGWRKGELAGCIQEGDRIDLAYSFQFSEYLGEERLNLSIEDIRYARQARQRGKTT
ncbi:MAG: single-stranded-DNA-specific exonuclease RecJ [Candidatus Aminicenantes bacterium]|nr:MAG: single-stranded-DNA-specific exonuclease RecJ [Candidatus Aminicenantes bacterium]